MAIHNQVRVVGYVLGDVIVKGETVPGGRKVYFTIRTMPRAVDFYHGEKYQDILVFYDGSDEALMNKMTGLQAFDLVDIKGVFNVMTIHKRTHCPYCGAVNIKYHSSTTMIYPIHLMKLNALYQVYEQDNTKPEILLAKHYREISNQVIICGTVVNEPVLKPYEKSFFCKYQLGINRKYYIATQNEMTADYIWIYTFGQQAEDDERHLIPGATILVDGFMRNRKIDVNMECTTCGKTYNYPDVATEFIPYSIEYLKGYLTDEEIAEKEQEDKQQRYQNAKQKIFGQI